MSKTFDQRWLTPGAVVPVDIETTSALIKEIQSLKKDAARYRWLRKNQEVEIDGDTLDIPGAIDVIFVSDGNGCGTAEQGDDLDVAIDKAMQRWPNESSPSH